MLALIFLIGGPANATSKIDLLVKHLRDTNNAQAAALGVSAGCWAYSQTNSGFNINFDYWNKLFMNTLNQHPAKSLVVFMEEYLQDRHPSSYNPNHYKSKPIFRKIRDTVEPIECVGGSQSVAKQEFDQLLTMSQSSALEVYDLFFEVDKRFAAVAWAHFAETDPKLFRFVTGLPWDQ